MIICRTPHFVSIYLIDFSKVEISRPNFAFFTVKSPSVTQILVSQKKFLKRAKTHRLVSQHYNRFKLFFYYSWKQYQVFKIAKLKFKVTVQYGLWAKCTQLWPLIKDDQTHRLIDPLNLLCWTTLTAGRYMCFLICLLICSYQPL